MSQRTTFRRSAILVFLVSTLAANTAVSLLMDKSSPPGDRELTGPIPPRVSISGGTDTDQASLQEAIDRFEAAGLRLPDLDVVFSTDEADCRGHLGTLESDVIPIRMTICSDLPFVYAHELAHAWIGANANQGQREELMEILDLDVWSELGTEWNERGSEHAAIVIQQGVAGLALPNALGPTRLRRLAAYEALTETVAPVLIDWLVDREVACDDRPTPLSRVVADRAGVLCGSSRGAAAQSRSR